MVSMLAARVRQSADLKNKVFLHFIALLIQALPWQALALLFNAGSTPADGCFIDNAFADCEYAGEHNHNDECTDNGASCEHEAHALDYIDIADAVDSECCAEEHECALEDRFARLLRGCFDSLELIAALLKLFSESRGHEYRVVDRCAQLHAAYNGRRYEAYRRTRQSRDADVDPNGKLYGRYKYQRYRQRLEYYRNKDEYCKH